MYVSFRRCTSLFVDAWVRNILDAKKPVKETYIYEKNPLKETYIYEKRHASTKRDVHLRKEPCERDIHLRKETCIYEKRRVHLRKETYIYEKRHTSTKRDLHLQKEPRERNIHLRKETYIYAKNPVKEIYIYEKRHTSVWDQSFGRHIWMTHMNESSQRHTHINDKYAWFKGTHTNEFEGLEGGEDALSS